MKIKNGFTLMELLIVVALIAIIATVAIVLFNPWAQIGKGYDARRKHDLAVLQKVMEDYYNDKGCYPKPADICYDLPPINTFGSGAGCSKPLESQTCHICGNESNSPPFPYLSKLPCDPQHKQKQYFYEVEAASELNICTATPGNSTSTCPQWYRVYSTFSNKSDSSTKELGCQGGGCGIDPIYGYDYGVTSPNKKLRMATSFYCYNTSFRCNSCGATYEICESRSTCTTIYSSLVNCCLRQPKPDGC